MQALKRSTVAELVMCAPKASMTLLLKHASCRTFAMQQYTAKQTVLCEGWAYELSVWKLPSKRVMKAVKHQKALASSLMIYKMGDARSDMPCSTKIPSDT